LIKNIRLGKTFIKEAKKLDKKHPSFRNDLDIVIERLRAEPTSNTSMGAGIYKARLAIKSKNQGKSGGARLIYFHYTEDFEIVLLSIYDKSKHSDISKSKLEKILKEEGLV
jgi:hypothetical protein